MFVLGGGGGGGEGAVSSQLRRRFYENIFMVVELLDKLLIKF